MFKMSTSGRGSCVQMFAKVVNSFVDRCLWQVIPDLWQCRSAFFMLMSMLMSIYIAHHRKKRL